MPPSRITFGIKRQTATRAHMVHSPVLVINVSEGICAGSLRDVLSEV